jgi:hypothetical protein
MAPVEPILQPFGWSPPLDLRVAVLKRGVCSLVAESFDRPLDDLDVLLRHRPRSIALRGESHRPHPFTEFQEGLALPVIEVAA